MANKSDRQSRVEAEKASNVMREAPVSTLIVIENFNLVGLSAKADATVESPLSGWFCFVNRACNLAHIMHSDDMYSYI